MASYARLVPEAENRKTLPRGSVVSVQFTQTVRSNELFVRMFWGFSAVLFKGGEFPMNLTVAALTTSEVQLRVDVVAAFTVKVA